MLSSVGNFPKVYFILFYCLLSYFILFCLFYFFFRNLSICLFMETSLASYFPYQPRCNHPKVTASISFPAKATAPGNGESSSERQHLDLGCSFRVPASLLAPFLCSKTLHPLQMTPELGVNFFPPPLPGWTAAKPAVTLEGSSPFKASSVSQLLPD